MPDLYASRWAVEVDTRMMGVDMDMYSEEDGRRWERDFERPLAGPTIFTLTMRTWTARVQTRVWPRRY